MIRTKNYLIALGTVVALLLFSLTPVDQADAQQALSASGLVIVESTQSFGATWASLIAALDANPNIRTIAQVDHGAAASTISASLANNRVVIFGNPSLGTPIMQANRTAGIDLPQKMQVIEDGDRVFVTYNPPSYLAARHSTGDVATFANVENALAGLARAATKTEGALAGPSAPAPGGGQGLTTTASANDFDTTWSQLLAAIEASPAAVAFTVDHAANSGGVLAPTRLVVFGNPALGTPIMASAATAGIDLPLKMLVFEDDNGVTQVVSTAPSFVQARHRVGDVPTIAAATTAIANFTAVATMSVDTGSEADAEDVEANQSDGDEPAAADETDGDEVLGITELAITGSDPVVASLGVVLVAAGGAMLVASRRRQRH